VRTGKAQEKMRGEEHANIPRRCARPREHCSRTTSDTSVPPKAAPALLLAHRPRPPQAHCLHHHLRRPESRGQQRPHKNRGWPSPAPRAPRSCPVLLACVHRARAGVRKGVERGRCVRQPTNLEQQNSRESTVPARLLQHAAQSRSTEGHGTATP